MKNGILLIDKKEGMTSRQVDDLVKKRLGVFGCGHLGTLDPFATGLLIVGVGEGTKLFNLMDESFKTYRATLKLGQSTDTGDYTGKIVKDNGKTAFSDEEIIEVLNSFLGKETQIPPIYSAKHIDGERAYDLARQGKKIELKPQQIEVKSIMLLFHENDLISFECEVSKGAYIRTLGEDIAKKLGTCGHLISLRRTKIGSYDVKDAKNVDDFKEDDVIPLDLSLPDTSILFVDESNEKKVANGMKLQSNLKSKFLFPLNSIGRPLAIYQKEGDIYVCKKGFNNAYKNIPIYIIKDLNFNFSIFKDRKISVVIGEFDGIHKGHIKVLDSLRKSNLPKYVMTFADDFKSKIHKSQQSYLMSTEEKIFELMQLGFIDGIILIYYNEDIVSLKPSEFIDRIVRPFAVNEISIGEDFTFGEFGKGNCDDFVKAGIKTRVSELISKQGKKISSSSLKELISSGDVLTYRNIAGHYYCYEGEVIHGFEQGRKLGYPTINMISPFGKIIPSNGVYKTFTICNNGIYHSMTNIGCHPTINETDEPVIETNILDGFDSDIYGRKVKIIFDKKLRDEKKFDSIEELKFQLEKDREDCSIGYIDLTIGEYPFL